MPQLGWELDHLQYGSASAVLEPATDMLVAGVRLMRRLRRG
ncbi:MAG TPA: hypothetical protein VER03_18725 [Bryobacteraceae bacterium]|nr:hypothetical protein [Bryobacteraceae bacterium]